MRATRSPSLPAASAQRAIFLGDAPREGQDEAKRELRRWIRKRIRTAHDHASLLRSRHVDGGVAPPGGDEQTQRGQPCEQGSRKRRALAHRHDDVEGCEALHEGLLVCHVVAKHADLAARRQGVPRREPARHALIVIQHRDGHRSRTRHIGGPLSRRFDHAVLFSFYRRRWAAGADAGAPRG
jgi:hypothetical protein